MRVKDEMLGGDVRKQLGGRVEEELASLQDTGVFTLQGCVPMRLAHFVKVYPQQILFMSPTALKPRVVDISIRTCLLRMCVLENVCRFVLSCRGEKTGKQHMTSSRVPG